MAAGDASVPLLGGTAPWPDRIRLPATSGAVAGAQGAPASSGLTRHVPPRSPRAKRKIIDDRTGKLNVDRTGFPKRRLYVVSNLFHTLVNIPNGTFTALFFATYFTLFLVFAVFYMHQSHKHGCIPGVKTFAEAVWFSVQTSMTIGYGGDLTPEPSCTLTNLLIAVQSITSLLVGYSMMGLVYSRFSSPQRRATTITFSKKVVLRDTDLPGVRCLALRVGNLRKHQLVQATVRLMAAMNDPSTSEDESIFVFHDLSVFGGDSVFLALPVNVVHLITRDSPLYGLSVADMEAVDLELLVILEGVDSSTSTSVQALKSYLPRDVAVGQKFARMVHRGADGRRIVDFAAFDVTVPMTPRTAGGSGSSSGGGGGGGNGL